MWNTIEYSKNMLSEIIDMTIENYGENNDISKKEFIEHEYFENPEGDAYIKLAYDNTNNVLAGQYVVIPMKIKINKNEYPVILSLNTLTREQYRGQKIFITLAEDVYKECSVKGYMFCYGAPNPNSHKIFIKRLGFNGIGIMPLYLKIIHPSLLVKQKCTSSILSVLSKPLDIFCHKMRMSKKTNISIISINKENLYLIDDYWRRINNKYPIMGVRTADFFQWRYLDMPNREYYIWAACENDIVVGYIIGRITDVSHIQCGMIVDFLVTPNRQDIAKSLLCKAQKEFYTKEVSLMGCLMQKHFEEAKWLRKTGFFKCPKFMEPQPFPIILRKLDKENNIEELNNFKNWFFTMGDYDVI